MTRVARSPFVFSFRVSLHDTDAAGVMFFAHLFRHAHDAYEAFMTDIGLPLDALIRAGKTALPLVHAEADYQAPMRHGDRIDVEVRVADVARRGFRLSYRFLDATGQSAATALTVHVRVRPGTTGAEALPDELAAALRARQANDEPA